MAHPARNARSGGRPWGWHRLDPDWANRLVADAALPRGALVVDIGAGTGAISNALVAAGARVLAVEAHPGRARALRDRFRRDDVIVVEADAIDLRLPRRPYHVVANLPFAISAPVLRRLVQPGSRLVTAHVVLQDQVARRWTTFDAPAAARWRREFDAALGARVPRRAFTPPPRVDARVLRITRRR